MAWRLARSLEVLRDEIRALHPGTRVDTIGDAAHAKSASDHNPNGAGVVCAADFFGDKGLNLGQFAEELVAAPRHPGLKYVIYSRRIASASSGWAWRTYTGSNPHATHVHVSVGTGPDGKSVGPYDDTSPWLASSAGGMDDMFVFVQQGASGEAVKYLQYRLVKLGFLRADQVDGIYGKGTASALAAAELAHGTKTDGSKAGAVAWTRLDELFARKHAGKPGERGPKGDKGDRGPKGDPGQPDPIEYRTLAQALITEAAEQLARQG